MRTIPEHKPGHVLVELVWPESRGEKSDCKNYTGIVWSGRGDVQNYPEPLWQKLREHHDVWRLYEPREQAAKAVATSDAGDDLERRQQEAAGRNTDLVAVLAGFEDDSSEAVEDGSPEAPAESVAAHAAESSQVAIVVAHAKQKDANLLLTLEDLEAMPDEDVRQLARSRDYLLHHRLNSKSLRKHFMDAQASRAGAAEKKA